MELFKLVGKIAIDGVDQAQKDIEGVGKTAKSTASTIDSSNKSISSSNQSTGSSWSNLKSSVEQYKAQGMSTSQAWRQATQDMKASATDAGNGTVGAFAKIGAAIGAYLVVDRIIAFGQGCLQAAADAQAMESQFSQVFGNLESKASNALNNIANTTGVNENRMKGSFTKIAAFAKTSGMDTESSLKLSERAMMAVADSAAFYDRSLEETTESLQSFLKGNYENDAALGLSATETTRNAAANKLYGKSFNELSESQKQLTLLKMVEDANKTSGALGQAARESDTWTNVLGNLKQGWTDFQAVLGAVALPTAVQVVKSMASALAGLAEKTKNAIQWAKEHETAMKVIGIVFGTVGAAILGYNIYVNAATIATKLYSAATTIATTATSLFGSVIAFLTSPVTLVILAIGALVAAVVVMYNKFDWFKEIVDKVGAAIKSGLAKAIEFLKPYIADIGNAIKEFGSAVWDVIQDVMKAFQSFLTKVREVYNSSSPIVNAIKTLFSTTFNNIKIVVTTVFNIVKTTITTGLNVIKQLFNVATSIIKGDWQGAWNGIKNIVSTVVGGIKTNISIGLNGAKSIIKNTLNGIKSTFSSVWEGIKSIVSGGINKIKGMMKFSWSLPKIKMPRFSVSGGKAPWGFGGKGSLPKVSVSWYKKAYDEAMILNSPTVFGYSAASGKFLGGGDGNGNEVVAGEGRLMQLISAAVAEQNEAVAYYLQKIIAVLAEYFPQFLDEMGKPPCWNPDEMAAVMAAPMDKHLGRIQQRKDRGR